MKFERREFLHFAACAAAASTVPRLAKAQVASLEVVVWACGPRVVLVHGSVFNGPLTWKEQRLLGEHWRLEVINRRGYGNSPPPAVRSDFEEDARDRAPVNYRQRLPSSASGEGVRPVCPHRAADLSRPPNSLALGQLRTHATRQTPGT